MMRQLINILTLILTAYGQLTAQSLDTLLAEIQTKCENIKENMLLYDTTINITWGDEGDLAVKEIAYFNDSNIILIQVIGSSQTDETTMEYYFDLHELMFAFHRQIFYNRPTYWNETVSKKNGDHEIFDPRKNIVKEEKYYFRNGLLINWVDNNNNAVDLTIETNMLVGQGLIEDSYKRQEFLERK